MVTRFFFKVENVSIQEPDPETPLTHDIYLKPLKENAHIVLEHIYFDVDKAILRPESIEELERVVEILTQNPKHGFRHLQTEYPLQSLF